MTTRQYSGSRRKVKALWLLFSLVILNQGALHGFSGAHTDAASTGSAPQARLAGQATDGGAWVLKEPVVNRAPDRVVIPEIHEVGSFEISPTGASSTYSWSNEDTGRSGTMSTRHTWTVPPAVLLPGQTVDVAVSSVLSISGSGEGWHHYCDTYFWANPPGSRLASANLSGYEYNPGTKSGSSTYTVQSGPGTLQWYFGVNTSWNNGSSVTYDYEWRDSVPPTLAATATPTHTPAPTPTPAYDIRADGYEVNQAIQCIDPSGGAITCADNSIPLVRGKHTVLIVRPRVVIVAGTIDATDMTSFGARLVQDSPGSGSVDALEPVGVYAASQGTAELRFRLPLAWVDTPTLRLHVALDPNGMAPETDRTNNRLDLTLVTEERRSLDVMYVPIQYSPPGQVPTFPGNRIRRAATLAGKLFPLAHLGLSYRRGAPFGVSFPVQTREQAAVVIGVLQQMYVGMLFANPETAPDQLIGWLPSIPGNSISGKSDPLWITPQGTGRVLLAQDWDAVLEARTIAHELAHNLNARHPNVDPDGCKHLSLQNQRWPYADDRIQERGFDPLLMVSQPPSRKDLMTYCADRWISPFTYMELFRTNSFPLVPTPNAGLSKSALARARPAMTGPEIDTHTVDEARDWIVVRGTILRSGEGTLEPLVRLASQAVPPPAPSVGDYCVDQRLADARLAAICFDVDFLDDDLVPVDRESFLYVMPAEAGATLVRLSRGSTMLAERKASPNAPTVTIVVPFPALAWSGRQTAYWQANDADGDALTYQVLFSPDGIRWLPLAVNLTEPRLQVDTDSLPGGLNARLRVIATDGFHTAVDEVGPFAVAPKGPRPVIMSPEDGSTAVPGRSVLLVGGGEDPEDGPLDPASLTWTSDRTGALGSGESLEVRNLARGDHRITLRARDAEGNWGEDVILLHVRPHQVYLPFSLRGAARTDLPAPWIVPNPSAVPPTVPTPVPTATRWNAPTGEASATRTPTGRPTDRPTATWTPEPPVGEGISGHVTWAGQPAGGLRLWLVDDDGVAPSGTGILTTDTDSRGGYLFRDVPDLPAGHSYFVYYENHVSEPNPGAGYLWRWYARQINSYFQGEAQAGGDFDVLDVALDQPANGARVRLPADFCFTPRGIAGDTYGVEVSDLNAGRTARTRFVGPDRCVRVGSLPPGWTSGAVYYWNVIVGQGDPAATPWNYGTGYAPRMVVIEFEATPAAVPSTSSR